MIDGGDGTRVREFGNECLGLVAECYIREDNGAAGIEKLFCERQIDPCVHASVRIRILHMLVPKCIGSTQIPGIRVMSNGAKRSEGSVPLPAPVTSANFPLTSYDIL